MLIGFITFAMQITLLLMWRGGDCRDHDHMVVGFITTYAISAYEH
jgi:hypothetical protein